VVDAFYDAPDDVPGEPGVLLRAEPFERGVPDGARAWRILYTTTRDEGQPALASGLVVAPAEQAADPHPVVAWAHGTTGVDETCAPSVLDDPFGAGAFYALDDVIEQGWALVATDYVGLGTEGPHPYLIGQGEGRSVLDAVRAARQLDDLTVEDRTIVWGHSQGGHAALWTGQLAESYAPDVGVAGVAALAPASDLIGLVRNLPNVPGGSIFASYVAGPYADIYDELDLGEYVASGGEVTVRQIGERCLAEPSVFVSIVGSLATGMEIFSGDLSTGTMGELLAANSPTGPIPAPLLIGQGLADPLVLPAVQEGYVERLCESGQQVDFRTYEGRDHVGVVNADSPLLPELITWTQERLAGAEPIDTCG
jgi:acetyl esterase/lipase